MKSKLVILLFFGLGTGCLVGLAQQNAAQNVQTLYNQPAAQPSADAASAEPGGEVLPLVTFPDAPLVEVVRTLARQAGINIDFDPKVTQPGPEGQPPYGNVSIRWENITAEQALEAILKNNGLRLDRDPRTGVALVVVKEPAEMEPLVHKVIQLQYSNPTNIIAVVQSVFSSGRSKAVPDMRSNHIVVSATESEYLAIDNIIAKLDISPSQVLIEARFLQTSRNPRTSKGIDWTETLGLDSEGNAFQTIQLGNYTAPHLTPEAVSQAPGRFVTDQGTGTRINEPVTGVLEAPQLIASTADGFGPIGYLNASGVSAALTFLNNDNETELLATPRVVALEGEETELAVVRNIPIFEQELAQSVSGAPLATVTPNYNVMSGDTILNEVGIKLVVTPRIYGDRNVFLTLRPELSEREFPDATVTIAGTPSTSPIFARRRLNTHSMVPSGNTLVIGGLMSDRNNRLATKVPILGDIPVVGRAFRSDTKQRNKDNLIIFVTPTIIGADDYMAGDASREFLKTKPPQESSETWSSWDSTEPYNWSQPVY